MKKTNTMNNQTYENIMSISKDIHNQMATRGWWTNIKTGEDILTTRNRGELLALVTTELSEASYGNSLVLMDDKLPKYPMFVVELADAVIRVYDLIGAELKIHNYSDIEVMDDKAIFKEIELSGFNLLNLLTDNKDSILMKLVNTISQTVEHFRKGKHLSAVHSLFAFILEINSMFDKIELISGYNFDKVISDKLEYNRKRADHNIENRLKNGGKSF